MVDHQPTLRQEGKKLLNITISFWLQQELNLGPLHIASHQPFICIFYLWTLHSDIFCSDFFRDALARFSRQRVRKKKTDHHFFVIRHIFCSFTNSTTTWARDGGELGYGFKIPGFKSLWKLSIFFPLKPLKKLPLVDKWIAFKVWVHKLGFSQCWSSTRNSQVVCHLSTILAICCWTSVFEW